MQTPRIQSFFDAETSTVTHIVSDPATARAAIIDSVLDYDHPFEDGEGYLKIPIDLV